MLLLFNDSSPFTFISILGVVDKMPIKSLAKVPEFPKLSSAFFFIFKQPKPLPKIR